MTDLCAPHRPKGATRLLPGDRQPLEYGAVGCEAVNFTNWNDTIRERNPVANDEEPRARIESGRSHCLSDKSPSVSEFKTDLRNTRFGGAEDRAVVV